MFRRDSIAYRGAGFHVLVLVALGLTWILDGIEVTIVGHRPGAAKSADPWIIQYRDRVIK